MVSRLLLVGSMGSADEPAGGLSTFEVDAATGQVAHLVCCSAVGLVFYLVAAAVPGVFYAVDCSAEGIATTFRVSALGAVTVAGRVATGGELPCHVSVHPSGVAAYVSHYGSGSVSVHPVLPDGRLAAPAQLVQITPTSKPPRRDAPRAHMADIDPATGRLLVTDLGQDKLVSFQVYPSSGRVIIESAVHSNLDAGDGPRHFVTHRAFRGALVANELSSSAVLLAPGPRPGNYIPFARTALVMDCGQRSYAGAVRLSGDGCRAYITNRGRDTVAVVSLDDNGLRLLAETPAGGAWPSDLAVSDSHLYVANERSNRVSILAFDADGLPQSSGQDASVPHPACLLLVPRPAADPILS